MIDSVRITGDRVFTVDTKPGEAETVESKLLRIMA